MKLLFGVAGSKSGRSDKTDGIVDGVSGAGGVAEGSAGRCLPQNIQNLAFSPGGRHLAQKLQYMFLARMISKN